MRGIFSELAGFNLNKLFHLFNRMMCSCVCVYMDALGVLMRKDLYGYEQRKVVLPSIQIIVIIIIIIISFI